MLAVSTFKIGVFAIILDERGRVLLCHRRDHDLWNLPGGGLESGETPWEGVIREVSEEVGLAIEVDQLAGIYSKPDQDEVVFSFIGKVRWGIPSLSDEADRIDYFAVADLPRNTIPKHVQRIRDALERGDRVILKTQIGPSAVELLKKGEL